MANAKKCDRCGRYYEERMATAIENLAEGITKLVSFPQPAIIEVIEQFVDLCPECSDSLKRWMREKRCD